MSNNKKLTPIENYKKQIDDKILNYDKNQEKIMYEFQILYDILTKERFLCNVKKILFLKKIKNKEKKGIYLWGKVGRGKTYLMDMFFESLPIQKKERLHFHSLMQKIHSELKKLQSHKNPLKELTQKFIKNIDVLCIDELYIDDIADAMIIKSVIIELFKYDITIVITSNINVKDLYINGLQRQHFLPVLQLLEKNLNIITIDTPIDYRRIKIQKKELYFYPITKIYKHKCSKIFSEFSSHDIITIKSYIEINERKIKILRATKTSLWFNFKDICTTPRSKEDYIIIAKNFSSIILTNIPQLKLINLAAVKRFIIFIDELYEKKIKLVILAECELEKLYEDIELSFEFQRLISRITEMQTINYLNKKSI